MPKLSRNSKIPLNSLSHSRKSYTEHSPRKEKFSSVDLSDFSGSEVSDSDKMVINSSSYREITRAKSNELLLPRNEDEEHEGIDHHDEESSVAEFSNHVHLRRSSTLTSSSNSEFINPDKFDKLEAYTKYKYAAFFLLLSLISFVIQTETAVYVQHELGWNKPYCMLYFTHGSWCVLWPLQILISRIYQIKLPWEIFWRRNMYTLRTTAQMVETQNLTVSRTQHSPVPYLIRTTAIITCALTFAGGSWYLAVNMTSPSDLTAIYNCSTFFAYVFSVPILGEKPRLDKSLAVAIAIIGVLVVAYGDTVSTKHGSESSGTDVDNVSEKGFKNQIAGNLIIGIGSILYGFYEVLYKRLACPPEGVSAGRSMVFANAFGSFIGVFTLCFLWIPLPILHFSGLERFELPHGEAAWLLGVSVLANAIFSGSFLVLISLTSPVLSSVAALLTIFLVAVVDWLFTGIPPSVAATSGGILIISAFLILSWSTYKEVSAQNLSRIRA
ncbi:putative duf6 domain protein [Golovinomyces cichoracearum]|uniref:Putative duf6 domain protein n=1 Tax=Golovinomyces cichoracearum TaxID=62708 RepID=A0A420HTZ4_9PEZI|nr:putative duf6 domain protein [Golovinomyces cichoracearum]